MRLACVLRISGRAAAEAFREVKAPGKRKTWKKQAGGSEWNIRVPKGASRSFCQKEGQAALSAFQKICTVQGAPKRCMNAGIPCGDIQYGSEDSALL